MIDKSKCGVTCGTCDHREVCELSNTCVLCSWMGEDVELCNGKGEETNLLCSACQEAVVIESMVGKVKNMTPTMLVPLFRTIVAQSVGAIMAEVFDMADRNKTDSVQHFPPSENSN